MFHERLQQYECDYCHRLIERSEPVRFDDGKVFCFRRNGTSRCHEEYEREQVANLDYEDD